MECAAIEILPALFEEILIPPTVHRELRHEKAPSRVRAWAQSLPAWVKLQAPAVVDHSLNVDQGEKEAICLAREVKASAHSDRCPKGPSRSGAMWNAPRRHDRLAGSGGGARSAGFRRQRPAVARDQRPNRRGPASFRPRPQPPPLLHQQLLNKNPERRRGRRRTPSSPSPSEASRARPSGSTPTAT